MSALVVASLVPRLLDIHGDAQNAQVLAVRAGWQGLDGEVVEIAGAADAAGLSPDVITIGAGFDADAPDVLAVLREVEQELAQWSAAGVPLLAVGLGWELLSTSIELVAGTHTLGIGLFPGRAVVSDRKVGTVAIDSRWGCIVGYEYHLRDYVRGDGETPLGEILSGVGNRIRPDSRAVEGAVIGNRFGTGIRGPVLARNPRLADELITRALARREEQPLPAAPAQESADAYADRANRIVLENMKIGRDAGA